MPYVSRTQEEILKELQAWTDIPESKVEGTFEYDVFATNAIEFQKVELELEEAYQASFGHLTWGEYLEYRAAEHGVIRRAATKAKGEVTVTGNGTVKAGALFSTQNNTRFVALSDTTIAGLGTVEIEAQVAGESGNVAAGAINKIPLSIVGIHSVTNAEPTADGYDEESDEDLRDRYLTVVRYPSTSGNPQFYINLALEVSGVGAAGCVRCHAGRGTVKVVVVDSNFESPEDELIERVFEHIEKYRPIGVEVTVTAAEPVVVNIDADIVGNINLDDFKSGVEIYFKKMMLSRYVDYTAVDSYSEISSIPAGSVSRAMLGSIIVVEAGADDYNYDSMRLNGLATDIPLTVEQIPKLGTVTFRQTQTITG